MQSSAERSPREIGVIGAGPMGMALIRQLIRAGRRVHCHDIRDDALERAVAAGAVAEPSPRELAAACDLVLTFLPGPKQVATVALDPRNGVLAGLAPGGLMLDMSTCGPDTAERLGAEFARAGRRFVDCPVSRKPPDMTVLVGGVPGVLGAAEDVLREVSRTVVHCGGLGKGYATKLLNQHVKYAWYLASVEALVVAREFGLDPALAADAVEQCSGGESGLRTAAAYFRNDTETMRTRAPASTIAKDAELARTMARRAGVSSATLDVTADFFGRVMDTSYRDRPYPESCALLERPSSHATKGPAA